MDRPALPLPRSVVRAALVAIVLLGAALRLPGLDAVHLHPDEAAYAADARGFLSAPGVVFEHEAAGWVSGTYVWLAAPLLATPLSTGFAARLPAAVAGLLLIGVGFVLGRRLGRDDRAGLLTALALATAPWAFHQARLALGPSLIAPLVGFGCWALWTAGVETRPATRRLVAGVLALVLAVWTYAPARLVVPPLATLCVGLRPGSRQGALAALAPIWLVFLLLLPYTLLGRGSVHLHDVLAWRADAPLGENLYALGRGYVLHFTPRFLFSGNTSRGFAPEGYGLLPLWQAPLLVAGLLSCLASLRRPGPARRAAALLLGWWLLAPLAAAFTRDVPNAIRVAVGLPALAVIVGLGGVAVWDQLRPRLPRAARAPVLALAGLALVIVTAAQGWHYHTRYPQVEARFVYAGRRATVQAVVDAGYAERGAVLFPGQFWRAYLRLDAPDLPLRRGAAGWILGPGDPGWRVVHVEPGDLPPAPRTWAGDRWLVDGRAVLRALR